MSASTLLETRPTAVTVFPDRARVTRAGQAALHTGLQRLEVGNLPLALLPDSVRAAGRGTARAKLLGVSTRLEQFTDAPAETVRDLEQRIQALEDADADLAARAGLLEREQEHLHHLGAQAETFARGLALRPRTPADQAAIFDFIRDRGLANQAELLSLTRQRREQAKEADRLRRELSNLQSARPKQRYAAVAELEVSGAGEFSLELTYVVTGASWRPLYDLWLDDSGLNMTYLAEVAQNTGEDWPGVALTLSTARPSLSLVIPELDPWYLRPFVPRPPPAARASLQKMSMPESAAPAPSAMMPQSAAMMAADEVLAYDSAAVSESGASLTYRLAGQADVPGSNEPRKVTVAALNFKPDITYVTAPRLEAVAYRRAEIKNDSQYSFLPGSVQLFEAGDYLGATGLEFVAPGQTFELALGADERIRVVRELVGREVDKAFIIGDRRRIRYAYTIEVENLRDGPQTIYVRDQIPVARDEQIKVKLDLADPKPVEHSDLNVLEWKLVLDRGARRLVRLEFNVEHPRAMEVIGLL